jgi:hypothetical protein
MPTANSYSETSEAFNDNQRVVDEETGGKEIDSIDVSSG